MVKIKSLVKRTKIRLEVLDTRSYSSSSPHVLSVGAIRVCAGVHWSTWSILCVRGCLRWGCLGCFLLCSIFNELKSWVSTWRIHPNVLLAPCACTPVAGDLPGGSRCCLGACKAQGLFQFPMMESTGLSLAACRFWSALQRWLWRPWRVECDAIFRNPAKTGVYTLH